MSRALVPLTAGAFGGWWWLRDWALHSGFGLLGSSIVLGTHQIWVDQLQSIIIDWSDILSAFWQLSGLVIAWELRVEILYILRQLLILGGYLLGICLWILRQNSGAGNSRLEFEVGSSVELEPWTEQDQSLTCMAAAPAAPYPVGSFLLVSRPPNWDEIWVAGYTNGGGDILGRTTTSDGSQWQWVVVRPVGQSIKIPVTGGDGTRTAPPGVVAAAVNWICLPPACDHQWLPDAVEVINLSQEATSLLGQLASNPAGVTLNTAGAAGDLSPLVAQPPLAPGGVGVGVNAGNLGGQGLGLAGGGGGSPNAVDLKALESAVQQLQALALRDKEDRKKDKKSKKRHKDSSHKKKKKKKKSKKSKRSRSSTSSNSSTSSRSRSRSGSSTSSGPLKWKEDGKDRRVSYSSLTHVDQLKFKKKGDLVAFAAKNPGALTAHFLASVYARLSKGVVDRSGQLRDVSVGAWAQQFTGLTELRDLKEVYTLAEVLDYVNRREVARALDVLCQRILAIQSAKAKNGSWEKAESLELVNGQRSLASSSMLALTNQ